MATAYRIVKNRHARAALSGEGARLAGGRWNKPGEAVIYASESLALAAIETFVHLGDDALHIRFVYFKIEIPEAVTVSHCRRPPPNWRSEPPSEESMRYGSAWLRSSRTAVRQVPSAIVPSEKNFLLNPQHRDFSKLKASRPQEFMFDPRMWK